MIEEGQNKLEAVDNFLTTLKKVLRKHWGILLILGLGAGIYFVMTSEDEEYPEEFPEEYPMEELEPMEGEYHETEQP